MQYRDILKRKFVFWSIAVVATVLISCANTQNDQGSNWGTTDSLRTEQLMDDFSRSKLVAADFVATMMQLPESRPADTVLYTIKPATRFGELLLSALQSAGFDLRIGNTQSQRWLAYNANRDEMLSVTGNPIYTFMIAAGEIELTRSYEIGEYGIRPAGSMFVRGANSDEVIMDDSIFSVQLRKIVDGVNDKVFVPLVAVKESTVELNEVSTPKLLIGL